jgi:hypothetical protein
MLWKPFAILITAAPLGAIPFASVPAPIPAAKTTVSTMPNGGYGLRDSDATPPVRFQNDTTVRIATVSTQSALEMECGAAEAGKTRAACIRGVRGNETVILPNPCLPQFAGQDFAWRLCHELGHKEGWGPDHEP